MRYLRLLPSLQNQERPDGTRGKIQIIKIQYVDTVCTLNLSKLAGITSRVLQVAKAFCTRSRQQQGQPVARRLLAQQL